MGWIEEMGVVESVLKGSYLAGSGISNALLSGSLLLGLSLLQEGLGNENVLKGGGGAVREDTKEVTLGRRGLVRTATVHF